MAEVREAGRAQIKQNLAVLRGKCVCMWRGGGANSPHKEKKAKGFSGHPYMPGPVKAAFMCIISMSPSPTYAIPQSTQVGTCALKTKHQ